MLKRYFRQISQVPEILFNQLVPLKPSDSLLGQVDSFDSLLPYESYFEYEDKTELETKKRTIYVMADGGIGIVEKFVPMEHELLELPEISRILDTFKETLKILTNDKLSIQFILDVYSPEKEKEDKVGHSNSFVEEVSRRVRKSQSDLINDPVNTLVTRDYYITIRYQRDIDLFGNDLLTLNVEEEKEFQKDLLELNSVAAIIEDSLGLHTELTDVNGSAFVKMMRKNLHDTPPEFTYPKGNLRKNLLKDYIEFHRDSVGLGKDSIEVISLLGKPETETISALMVNLLKFSETARYVLNLRATTAHGLEDKLEKTRDTEDPRKAKQNEEIKDVRGQLERNEIMLAMSFHVFYRNKNVNASDRHLFKGNRFRKKLELQTKLNLFNEKYGARAIFMASLPLAFSSAVTGFMGREIRLTSKEVGSYLPIFGGFQGLDYDCELYLNRANEKLSLSIHSATKNQMLMVLGGSGSGKSNNLIRRIFAKLYSEPDTKIFILDNKTSYEFLGRAIGEDTGFNFIKPPEVYPNIFKGDIDQESANLIVSIIKTSLAIISGEKLNTSEVTLLTASILSTHNSLFQQAKTLFNTEGGLSRNPTATKIPTSRMSKIVEKTSSLVKELDLEPGVDSALRLKLLPFFGSGPYACIFDQEDYQEEEEEVAGFNIYDLESIGKNAALKSLISLVTVAEINRKMDLIAKKSAKTKIKKPSAYLIFEEVGVNFSSENEVLVSFVKEMVLTLRKRGIFCIGVTNKLEHITTEKTAGNTLYNLSSNKIIFNLDEMEKDQKESGFLQSDLEYNVVANLKKRSGKFSEGYFKNDLMKGTFRYISDGTEHWSAANEDGDRLNIQTAYDLTGSWQKAIFLLADVFPKGIWGKTEPRPMNTNELKTLTTYYKENGAKYE